MYCTHISVAKVRCEILLRTSNVSRAITIMVCEFKNFSNLSIQNSVLTPENPAVNTGLKTKKNKNITYNSQVGRSMKSIS